MWGAQGGDVVGYNPLYEGGYGGYSVGVINLNKDEKLYVVVGGAGSVVTELNVTVSGCYNGGGISRRWSPNRITSSGGGATHIAFDSGEISTFASKLNRLIIVAGGGGGATYEAANDTRGHGGSGGGFMGRQGWSMGTNLRAGYGGTQSAGGGAISTGCGIIYSGGFGKGAPNQYVSYHSSGGGGGLYGGGAEGCGGAAGGGSGYIANPRLLVNANGVKKGMVGWSVTTSTDPNLYTENISQVNTNPIPRTTKKGNGHAIITYLGE